MVHVRLRYVARSNSLPCTFRASDCMFVRVCLYGGKTSTNGRKSKIFRRSLHGKKINNVRVSEEFSLRFRDCPY
jgi:hypothetical protein